MISSIKILVELFAYLFCLAGLFGKKFKLSIHAVILIILDLFLLTGINEYGFPGYLVSLLYIGMFAYGLLCYGESIKYTLVNCLLAALFISILQILLCFPVYYIFIVNYGQKELFELIINLCCFSLVVMCYKKFQLFKISNFFIKRNRILFFVIMLVLIGFGINIYMIRRSNSVSGEKFIQIAYFVFIFSFIIYEWQKSRIDAEKKKMQLEMNKLYYDAYDQLIMLIRARQHDMKNHISAILSMIYTTDSYDELVKKQQEYCGYVIEQNEATKLLLLAGNPLITGFLYSKIQEAEKRSIAVVHEIDIQKEIAFPEYELVELLGILFDNAMEVLEKSKMAEKKIYVSIKEKQSELILVVSNISSKYEEDDIDKFFEAGYSSKGENRGIGLSKLKRIVNERKGQIIVNNEQYAGNNYLQFEIRVPKIE